jgi:hypothetical protein
MGILDQFSQNYKHKQAVRQERARVQRGNRDVAQYRNEAAEQLELAKQALENGDLDAASAHAKASSDASNLTADIEIAMLFGRW